MVSLGDWRYTDNFEAEVFDDNNEPVVGQQFTLYTEGAKVGDAQITNLGLDYRITKGLNVDFGYRYVDGLYADYDINSSHSCQRIT